ncbi:hypothetical protein Hanom_Chr11g01022721 [Helianthus anomalus]
MKTNKQSSQGNHNCNPYFQVFDPALLYTIETNTHTHELRRIRLLESGFNSNTPPQSLQPQSDSNRSRHNRTPTSEHPRRNRTPFRRRLQPYPPSLSDLRFLDLFVSWLGLDFSGVGGGGSGWGSIAGGSEPPPRRWRS